MLSLSQKIQALYPELQEPEDWEGIVLLSTADQPEPHIAQWEHSTLARPTESQLASVDEGAVVNARNLKVLRVERNRLLAETDYLALADSTLTDEMRTYRQALRDLPANTTDPANPVWPTKPE